MALCDIDFIRQHAIIEGTCIRLGGVARHEWHAIAIHDHLGVHVTIHVVVDDRQFGYLRTGPYGRPKDVIVHSQVWEHGVQDSGGETQMARAKWEVNIIMSVWKQNRNFSGDCDFFDIYEILQFFRK